MGEEHGQRILRLEKSWKGVNRLLFVSSVWGRQAPGTVEPGAKRFMGKSKGWGGTQSLLGKIGDRLAYGRLSVTASGSRKSPETQGRELTTDDIMRYGG